MEDSAVTEPLKAQTEEEEVRPVKKRRCQPFRPTVEPLVALFMFTLVTSGSVTGGLYLERACGSADTARCPDDRRAHATVLLMYKSITEAIVPSLLAPFLGPWSDRYGRRPVFLWGFAGNAASNGLLCWLCTVQGLQAEWLLLPSVVSSFSGGVFNLMAIANVYIADVSPEDQKEVRLGVLDTAQYVSLMLGSGLAAPIFTYTSYVGAFGIATSCMALCFLYTLLLLPESKAVQQRGGKACGVLGDIFQPELVREALRTAFRRRPHHGRAAVLLVVVVVVTNVFIMLGEGVVNYPFVNKKFGWTVQDAQIHGLFSSGVSAIGTLGGVFLMVKLLKLSESTIVVIAYSSKIAGDVLAAISPEWWYIYLSSAVSAMGGMIWTLVRSMLTRLVDKDEIGKVFSLSVTLEAMLPIAASPLYTAVFNATMDTFAGGYHLASGAIMVIDAVLLLLAIHLNRGAKKPEKPEEEKVEH